MLKKLVLLLCDILLKIIIGIKEILTGLNNIYNYRQTFIGKPTSGVENDNESSLGNNPTGWFGVRKSRQVGTKTYDDFTGRFFQIDPMWEKYYSWAPYHYSANNPVSFLDPSGLLPGDKFTTERMAAHDFGKNYNLVSFVFNAEVSTTIYKSKGKDGKYFYTYAVPNAFNRIGSNPALSTIDDESYTTVSEIHTHGPYSEDKIDPNNFSRDDYKDAEKRSGLKLWLVTPDGSLKYYNPNTGEEKTTNKSLPSDQGDVQKSNFKLQDEGQGRPIPLRIFFPYEMIIDAKTQTKID